MTASGQEAWSTPHGLPAPDLLPPAHHSIHVLARSCSWTVVGVFCLMPCPDSPSGCMGAVCELALGLTGTETKLRMQARERPTAVARHLILPEADANKATRQATQMVPWQNWQPEHHSSTRMTI